MIDVIFRPKTSKIIADYQSNSFQLFKSKKKDTVIRSLSVLQSFRAHPMQLQPDLENRYWLRVAVLQQLILTVYIRKRQSILAKICPSCKALTTHLQAHQEMTVLVRWSTETSLDISWFRTVVLQINQPRTKTNSLALEQAPRTISSTRWHWTISLRCNQVAKIARLGTKMGKG